MLRRAISQTVLTDGTAFDFSLVMTSSVRHESVTIIIKNNIFLEMSIFFYKIFYGIFCGRDSY